MLLSELIFNLYSVMLFFFSFSLLVFGPNHFDCLVTFEKMLGIEY